MPTPAELAVRRAMRALVARAPNMLRPRWLCGPADWALEAAVGAGFVCALLLTLNRWPRAAVAGCTVLLPSCVAVLQNFSVAPLRVANTYGLFATMTPAEDEIEFQGTRDGRTWVAYPFRYKPQAGLVLAEPGGAPPEADR